MADLQESLRNNLMSIAKAYEKDGKIAAIKEARKLTSCGLVEAKNFVDWLETQMYPGGGGPTHSPLNAKIPGVEWNAACRHCNETRGHHRSHPMGTNRYLVFCLDEKHLFELPQQEPKPMPTRQYGINQKMLAKFPGKCHLCNSMIEAGVHTILPLLSERTPRGRHPWVHEACYQKDSLGQPVTYTQDNVIQQVEDNTEPPTPPSRFLVDPPRVSQRQISVVAKNLEAVLQALAKNPGQVYALVPATAETTDAVLVTEAIKPQADAASA